MIDFNLTNHGSLYLLQPITAAANQWVEDHLPSDVQFWGTSVAVEPRYVGNIVEGIRDFGLTVE